MSKLDVDAMRSNVLQISRTLQRGVLDASAASEKASLLTNDPPSSIKQVAASNLTAAINIIASSLRHNPQPLDARDVTERINRTLTHDLLTPHTLYRSHNSPHLPYIAFCDIPAYATMAYRVIDCGRASPTALSAFAIWAIDFRGHLFSDGCGKTAILVSALLLARAGHPIPRLPTRAVYYAAPYDGERLSWKKWLAAYSELSRS